MNFPNNLDALRDLTQPSVLYCGAGLSAGSVPASAELFLERHRDAERELGIVGVVDHQELSHKSEHERLYAWADRVLEELSQRGASLPKLRLAEALNLIDDPRWWGDAEIDFSGNSRRFRVIARFAKEGILHSVWSFNWDRLLENAFEQVGLPEGEPRFRAPWVRDHFVSHVHSAYLPTGTDSRALTIHKPHGCVRALRLAREVQTADASKAQALCGRMMVGERELRDRSLEPADVRNEDNLFYALLCSEAAQRLNFVIGWTIGEKTICDQLMAGIQYQGTRFAVVNPEFSDGHSQITCACGLNQSNVHFLIREKGCPNRDDLFLWQQALYALDRLELNIGQELRDANGEKWRERLVCCSDNGFLQDWADEFLPCWTRLCWSAGLVTARAMPSHQINLERKHEHIPLSYDDVERPDLQSAARMLSEINDQGDGFDAFRFPGGLFHVPTGILVIPLPCWGEVNELRALKPLLDALRSWLSFVSTISIWTVGDTLGTCDEIRKDALRASFSRFVRIPRFADPGNIQVIDDLQELSDATN